MKKLLILVSLTVFSFSNAIAVTLYDALNQTYQNNIQLNAERENIKASEEDINISKADYKPTITLSGSKSLENTNNLQIKVEEMQQSMMQIHLQHLLN